MKPSPEPAGPDAGLNLIEEEPTRSRPDRDPSEPSRGRRKGSKKRKRGSRPALPRWVWVAGTGGVLGFVGLIALVVALVSGGGGGNRAAAAQDPRPGRYSWVPATPVPGADPGTWKVAPDPAPLAAGLRSELPLPAAATAVLLPGPGSAAAAALLPAGGGPGVEWVRLDLKAGTTTRAGVIPLQHSPGRGGNLVAALSPSGDRLAVPNSSVRGEVIIWAAGGEAARFRAPVGKTDGRLGWIGFAGEGRVLTAADGRVSGWDAGSGRAVFTLPVEFKVAPTVTPGGKWLAGFTGTGFEWFSAADGSPAGVLPLPAGASDPNQPLAGLAVRPDGKTAAGFTCSNTGDVTIAVWDLADGRPAEALVLPHTHLQSRPAPAVSWAGDRRLLFASGEVIDLDLRTRLCKYELAGPLPGDGVSLSGTSPDGRHWRVARPGAAPGRDAAAAPVLAAATLPHPGATAAVEAARDGFLWHPGVAVRAEVDDSCPKAERGPLLEALADALAARGYRVDPAAKFVVRVSAKLAAGKVLGDHVKQLGPNQATYKVASGYIGEGGFEITNAAGRKMINMPTFGPIYVADKDGSGREDAWRQIRERVRKTEFPRLFLRDAAGTSLRPEYKFAPGIDGGADPSPLPTQQTGLTGFTLPGDERT